MAEFILFQPRHTLNASRNLADFIDHCQNKLPLYEEQGGFNVNQWTFILSDKRYAIVFSKYSVKGNTYHFEPLEEPFLTFAKARVRYTQSQKQVKSISIHMIVLRLMHDALLAVHEHADVLKIDGLVLMKMKELADLRYPKSDLRYRLGQQMESVFDFLRNNAFVPTLPDWINPWNRGLSKAERVDIDSRQWQAERCPSAHQMLAIADCFAKAISLEDQYWSSVLTMLIFAPSRAGELRFLTVDCLHFTENGRLGVRWFGEKGFGDTIKWVPDVLRDTVIEAHRRLVEIGLPARKAAKFSFDNPGVFYRHTDCITSADFPENKALNVQEFAHAMNFGKNTLKLLSTKYLMSSDETRWNVLGSSEWINKLRLNGNPTYRKLANYTLEKYRNQEWPYIVGSKKPIWDSLLLIRDREFHQDLHPKAFSWVMPNVNQINGQLAERIGLEKPNKTIFQRFNIVDEDGSDISLTSHQLRVWLSTNAERGGMDSWLLANWAGRARIQDNKHYDLRTPSEREEQVKSVMNFTERPSVLQAIQMNLPVSYSDLGLHRIGIADVTEYGMCTHDYAMSPCTKGGECMTCKEHVCIKGMPNTLERIKILEDQVNSQFEKSQSDASAGAFGADRWATHLGWKLAHIQTIRRILESNETSVGTIISIPSKHDPSPIMRALDQTTALIRSKNINKKKFDPSNQDSLLRISNA